MKKILATFLLWALLPTIFINVAQAQGPQSLCVPIINSAGNKSCVPVGMTGAGTLPYTYNWLPVGGLANAAAPTYTEGRLSGLSFDLSGNLRVASSGGSGGAVTIADGADVAEGSTTDAAATQGGTGTLSAKLRLLTTQFNTLNTTVATAANQATMITAIGTPMQQTGGTVGLVAAEAHIGEVGGNLLPITSAMTTSNATVTTGQSIGGLQTLTSAVRVSGSLGASGTSGLIQSAVLTFADAVTGTSIDIYYFNANPTGSTCTNANAFALVTADRDKVIGVVHMTDFTASNTIVIGQAQNQAMPFGVASATSIYACVVARASFAITSTANASLITRILRN